MSPFSDAVVLSTLYILFGIIESSTSSAVYPVCSLFFNTSPHQASVPGLRSTKKSVWATKEEWFVGAGRRLFVDICTIESGRDPTNYYCDQGKNPKHKE
jgi:hypothetical protein